MFPRIPSSFLVKLVELSKMECNATPIDLSPIQEQLKSYLPVVARIGNRHDFSQVILKLLFLSVMLSSTSFSPFPHSRGQHAEELAQVHQRHLCKNSLQFRHQYIPEKDIKTRFSDVVGLGENMDELRLMVEFLQVSPFPPFSLEPAEVLLHRSEVSPRGIIHGSAGNGENAISAGSGGRGGSSILLRGGFGIRRSARGGWRQACPRAFRKSAGNCKIGGKWSVGALHRVHRRAGRGWRETRRSWRDE